MSKVRIALLTCAAVLALTACGTPSRIDRAESASPAVDLGAGTPGAGCATSRVGKSFVQDGVTYTCRGPKPYRWMAAVPASAPTTAPSISTEQRNATQAAQEYLASQSFSRKGLIRQLSSSAGEGYSVKASTAAVDSLRTDWNEQAAKSAQEYLSTQSFSRNSLIRQLESSAGEGFTHSQAVYGVKAAGL